MANKIGIFSFFSGAGFLDLGFEHTDLFEVLFANEFHKPFLEIYLGARKKMMMPQPVYGCETDDIVSYGSKSKIDWFKNKIQNARKSHEYIGFIGGPPCPDFSVGGKNRGKEGDNGKLSGTYINIICRAKPDFFVFENVKGLYKTSKHREFFDSLKSKLRRNGFVLTEKLINAIEYGAPQDRERIILIGFNKRVLKNSNGKITEKQFLQEFNWENRTEYNAENVFSLNWATTDRFEENSERHWTNSVPLELTVEHWFNKNEVTTHANANDHFTPKAGLKRFQVIDEGDDSKKSFKRLHRWRYSPTAAYGNNEVHLHPYKARRISASEALAIQTLPKEFEIPEGMTLTNMFKAIGNGVPYLAARGIAFTINDFISSHLTQSNES